MDIGGTTKTAQIFSRELATTYKDYYDVFILYNAVGDLTRYRLFEMCHGSNNMISYMTQYSGSELLAALRPDIVHVYRSGLPEWPGKQNKSIFVETNVFGQIDLNNPPDKSLFMSNWLLQQAKRAYGDRESFDFVNNPTDRPISENDDITLTNSDLVKDPIVLGRCGRPDDGIYDDISLKAIMLLQSKYSLHFLVVAPPPRMIKHLEQYGIDHTIIEPTTDEVLLNKFYNRLHIYCHSRADGETYGNNIAEAMAHGKPVVTHVAVPSHPGMGVFQAQTELVEQNKTGFITGHSVSEYANALEHIITNPQVGSIMGAIGKEKFERELSTQVSCAKLHSIYQQLLKEKSHLLREPI
jgi:glycosyltransferase involved in cell wall biosynthesis